MKLRLKLSFAWTIVVLGDSGVGKTSIAERFCKNKPFSLDQPPETTVGVGFLNKTVKINGQVIHLHIWDTAGQEKFRCAMVSQYYRNAHGVILVYDVTNMDSFKNIEMWLKECNDNNIPDDVPKILVGNKTDATDDVQVSKTLARRFALDNSMEFFETSAHLESEERQIENIFVTLAFKMAGWQALVAVSEPDPDPVPVVRLSIAPDTQIRNNCSVLAFKYC